MRIFLLGFMTAGLKVALAAVVAVMGRGLAVAVEASCALALGVCAWVMGDL